MNTDWQTLAAAGIVIITLSIFLIRLTVKSPKKGGSCGSGCNCKK